MDTFTRRDFIRTGSLALLAAGVAPALHAQQRDTKSSFKNIVRGNRPVRVAAIGIGGRADANIRGVEGAGAEIVALCDVDFDRGKKTFNRLPDVPRYKDYRKMLEEMDDQIDAVVISTPDHMHFPPTLLAIQKGKHVYVEKPLTHTIGEARILKDAARKAGVVTIMGNQGHASDGTRRLKEWVDAGHLGDVREIHAWTNRPVWPQGMGEPSPDPVPDTLDWNLWQGVAPERKFSKAIVPFKWRGYWDYGCGALGDMACHIFDAPFWALDLTGPVEVSADFDRGPTDKVSAPAACVVTYSYPARGKLPPLKLYWYEGKAKRPEIKGLPGDTKVGRSGVVYYGDKATVWDDSTYGRGPKVIPREKTAEFMQTPATLPRVPRQSPYVEFIEACKGGAAPGSRIDGHAADLTEMVLLGNLAMRSRKPIKWDPAKMACVGAPEMDIYINKKYRNF